MTEEIICDSVDNFTAAEIFDIITHFRDNRLLWDTKNKQYKNNTARIRSMMNLADMISQKRGGREEIKSMKCLNCSNS